MYTITSVLTRNAHNTSHDWPLKNMSPKPFFVARGALPSCTSLVSTKDCHYTVEGSLWMWKPLWAGQSGVQIPAWVWLSAPIQTDPGPTQPPVHWVPGFLPRVNHPGCDVDHQPQSSTKVKGRVGLYLYSPIYAFMACCRMNFVQEINQILMCVL